MDRAQHDIYLETYIHEDDATGQRIADALKRAASRGVKVYVLIDDYGSQNLPRSMRARLRTDGEKILTFQRKIAPWTFQRQFRRALIDAAARGVRVVLLLQGKVEFFGNIKDRGRCMGLSLMQELKSMNTARVFSTPRWPSSTGIEQRQALQISIRSACCLHLKRIWWLMTKHLARPCRKA